MSGVIGIGGASKVAAGVIVPGWMRRDDDHEATIVAKFTVMAPVLDERARRLWAAAPNPWRLATEAPL